MASCPHKESCAMYSEFKLKSVLRFWQELYCNSDFSRCARHELSIQGKPVPINLLPNGKTLAAKGGSR
ncbi:MAG TPA: hypothetical protein VM580_18395 [Labilithrix sp.]|nr:hypothetical protein [Labilithrix sp.]